MRFMSQKDFNLVQHFNRELIDKVVDVTVILYKIVAEATAVNLYGEATEKERYTPVALKAIVKYTKNVSTTESGMGVDQKQNVTFRFARALLAEVNVYPEIGDIVRFDDGLFEIDNINETQLIGGQPQYQESLLCSAHLTRRSGLQIDEANA